MKKIPIIKTVIPGIEVVKLGSPLFAQMELTSECPYQCIFCYNVWKCSDNNSSKGMTRNQAFFVAEELIKM